MYYVEKQIEISSAHFLEGYEGQCQNLHGHNWIIKVYCKSETLDNNGMVTDFVIIKKVVKILDHKNLNEYLGFNPTAENIAKWIYDQVPNCYQVDVWESKNNLARFKKL
jgi:6-pyruvoyltetrahydropterin/6-carboxytetrahydropterin synthase